MRKLHTQSKLITATPTIMEDDSPPNQAIVRGASSQENAPDPVPYARGAFGIPLYTYHEIPSFLKWNPGIKEGYRAGLPVDLCLRSLLVWSNESINIWTHLIGIVYFTFLILEDNFAFLPEHKGEFGDHLTFTCLTLCFQICMVCSTGYHLFNCMSETVLKKWLHLDLGGVAVGLCGCYFPGAYYAFYCERHWQVFYMMLLAMLALVSMFTQLHPEFLSAKWHLRRLFLYSALVFAGVVPVVHWIVNNGGFQAPVVVMFLPRIFIIYVLAVLGGTFYASRFPESRFPGKVDYIGSSHQWWHALVLLAFIWTHHCAVVIFLYWRNHTCSEHAAIHKEFFN